MTLIFRLESNFNCLLASFRNIYQIGKLSRLDIFPETHGVLVTAVIDAADGNVSAQTTTWRPIMSTGRPMSISIALSPVRKNGQTGAPLGHVVVVVVWVASPSIFPDRSFRRLVISKRNSQLRNDDYQRGDQTPDQHEN